MKKLLLTLSLIAFSSSINAQWTLQNTNATTANRLLDDIQIVNANTVWIKQFKLNAATGDAPIQEFALTTDGGTTWTQRIIDLGNTNLSINEISPVSETTAWVSAINTTDGSGSSIWKTSDGGATWEQQNTSGFTSATSFIDGVHFFNETVGVAFGDPATATATTFEIWRTTDGGNTWTSISSPAITSGDYGYNSGFTIAGNTIWFGTAKGKVYKSTDMGATWIKYNSPIADFGAQSTATSSGRMYFSDANNGILIGNTVSGTGSTATITARKLYKTTNGGVSWSTGVTYTQPYTYSMCYVPGTTMLVGVGSTGTGASLVQSSGISNDNGTTWTQIDSGVGRYNISFFNTTTGWAGGVSSGDPFTDSGIYKFTGNLATNKFSINTFNISPNPATNNVVISSNDVDTYKLNVTDITGKTLISNILFGLENNVDINFLSSGIYFFTLNSDNKTETVKIIKN